EVAARTGLVALNRANPRARRALARLRGACEQAKIDLSRAAEAVIAVPELTAGDREPVDVDLTITREQLEALMAPLLERSVTVVRGLLQKNRRTEADVRRVVLVGGPTLTPGLRARLSQLFDGRLAEGIDPMTIVARGAALYAGTAGLDARPQAPPSSARVGLAVRVEHPAVTADLEPFVVGRFLPTPGERLPATARIVRVDRSSRADSDGGTSVTVSPEGSFVTQVRLDRGKQNHFRLSALDDAGAPIRLATEQFAIVHGISIADPPLSRSIGIACADDLVQVYFTKGTPLPARKTLVLETAQPVTADGRADALAIPVVQGESSRAHRNRLVGLLSVRGARQDLPAGSRIEVTLQLDRSGQLHARADLPALGQTFEEVVHLLVPSAVVETLARELEAAQQRVEAVQRRAFEAGASQAIALMSGVAGLLYEATRALPVAEAGDADAAQKLHRLLLDAATALDDAEALMEWPELESESRRSALYYTPLVAAWGTPAEQQLFDQILQAATTAEKAHNAFELERHLEAMRA
ncbi:MAG TPA: Hsp70 family protein, partial [Polyangia bacterium]|nr:Hsp70 family protein [Polyangia bacterium]